MKDQSRGIDRERSLKMSEYFSEQYFSMPQLASLSHQLNHIVSMKPKSAIEIGIGNGFVSTFLKRANLPVTTADINGELEPDICAPLSEVRGQMDGEVDVVICCEVLEHMPLSELDDNLDYLKSLGDRLYLTLPNSYRSWGFSGIAFLPRLGAKLFDLNFNVPWKRVIEGSPHFWEVGYSRECSRSAMIERLRKRYPTVRSGRFALNPYHMWFMCE